MSRHIVIEGNLTRDPNGGYGKDTGKAYTHLDVAVTDRIKSTNGEWVDGPPTYFGKTAENALNSLTKGNTIIAAGRTHRSQLHPHRRHARHLPTTSRRPSRRCTHLHHGCYQPQDQQLIVTSLRRDSTRLNGDFATRQAL
jgi:hypothetical protein